MDYLQDSNAPPIKTRSKSEALLETNFDLDGTEEEVFNDHPLTKSKSQPLETAMWGVATIALQLIANAPAPIVFIKKHSNAFDNNYKSKIMKKDGKTQTNHLQ